MSVAESPTSGMSVLSGIWNLSQFSGHKDFFLHVWCNWETGVVYCSPEKFRDLAVARDTDPYL